MSDKFDRDRIEEMNTQECDPPRIPDQPDEDGEECEGFADLVRQGVTLLSPLDEVRCDNFAVPGFPPTVAQFDRVADLLRYWNALP